MSKHRSSNKNRVGYARPPQHSQFKPGQSGNPRGRPKSRPVAADPSQLLMRALNERIAVVDGSGSRQYVTRIEVIIKSLLNAAMKGDLRAAGAVLKWLDKLPPSDTSSDQPLPDYGAEVRAKLDAMVRGLQGSGVADGTSKPVEG